MDKNGISSEYRSSIESFIADISLAGYLNICKNLTHRHFLNYPIAMSFISNDVIVQNLSKEQKDQFLKNSLFYLNQINNSQSFQYRYFLYKKFVYKGKIRKL